MTCQSNKHVITQMCTTKKKKENPKIFNLQILGGEYKIAFSEATTLLQKYTCYKWQLFSGQKAKYLGYNLDKGM